MKSDKTKVLTVRLTESDIQNIQRIVDFLEGVHSTERKKLFGIGTQEYYNASIKANKRSAIQLAINKALEYIESDPVDEKHLYDNE